MKRIIPVILALVMLFSAVQVPASAMTQQEMLERVRQAVSTPTPAPTATPAPETEPAEEPGTPAEGPAQETDGGEDDVSDGSAAPAAGGRLTAAFTKGYVYVKAGLKAWRSASGSAAQAGVFGEDGVVFAVRANAEWLEAAFVNAANRAVTVVFVKAADVTEVSGPALVELTMKLRKAPKYEGYLLPAILFSAPVSETPALEESGTSAGEEMEDTAPAEEAPTVPAAEEAETVSEEDSEAPAVEPESEVLRGQAQPDQEAGENDPSGEPAAVTNAVNVTASVSPFVVSEGLTVTFSVSDCGEGAAYQWQFADAADAPVWQNSGLAGSKTASFSFSATKPRVDGRYYRCVVTQNGYSVCTNAVKADWSSDPVGCVTASADQDSAALNETVTFSASVSGMFGSVSYQWQFTNTPANEKSWGNSSMSGAKTAALSFKATETRIKGRYYRCVVTDDNGTWYSNAVTVSWHVNPTGSCGADLTWTLDKNGVLTVSGTGRMTDYIPMTSLGGGVYVGGGDLDELFGTDKNGHPWEDADVRSVVIENGVTYIGTWAFHGCSSLSSVRLPKTLTSIGEGAFSGCSSLSQVLYADSLSSWEQVALGANNGSLTSAALSCLTAAANAESASYDDAVIIHADDPCPGANVSYRWQYTNTPDTASSWKNTTLSGFNTDTLSFTATRTRVNGRYYRCAVKDGTGTRYTDPVTVVWAPHSTVTASADRESAALGDQVTMTVTAQGTAGELSYQWQFSNTPDVESSWKKTGLTGSTSDTLSFSATQARVSGRSYRCAVTDSDGTWYSNAVSLRWIVLVSADADKAIATEGNSVTFSASVKGASGAPAYQWQFSNTPGNESSWKNTTLPGNKEKTLSFTVTQTRLDGRYYRCTVTDDEGVWYSNAVTVTWTPKPSVTLTPSAPDATEDEAVTISAQTLNTIGTLSFQWEFSTDNRSWKTTVLPGNKTDALNFSATQARISGKYYRCKVTDQLGTWTSDSVQLAWIKPAVITAHSTYNNAYLGEEITVVAEAADTVGALVYQWQYSNDQKKWNNTTLSGYDTDILSFSATNTRIQGRYYRCKVTDANRAWYSDPILFEMIDQAFITVSASADHAVLDDPVSFIATHDGTSGTLSFQWEYSEDSGESWKNTTLDGCNSDTLAFAATKALIDGRLYRFTVTDEHRTWYSGAASIEWFELLGPNVTKRSQSAIQTFVNDHPASMTAATFRREPTTDPYKNGLLSDETNQQALNLINQIRYIAGLNADVELDASLEEMQGAGALINALNGGLSHYPSRPSQLADSAYDELYEMGCDACGSSNIAAGSYTSLNYHILLYMNDSDASNINRVGHRRWILNPSLKYTAFGASFGSGMYRFFSNMHVFDWSGSGSQTLVAWPAQNTPTAYFSAKHAWSLSFGRRLNADNISVDLVSQSTGRTWHFDSKNADGDFYIDNGNYGLTGCVIFRPADMNAPAAGDVYQVSITDTSMKQVVRYTVSFFALNNACE